MNTKMRLKELGLELPEVPKPVAEYVPASSSWTSRGCRTFSRRLRTLKGPASGVGHHVLAYLPGDLDFPPSEQ